MPSVTEFVAYAALVGTLVVLCQSYYRRLLPGGRSEPGRVDRMWLAYVAASFGWCANPHPSGMSQLIIGPMVTFWTTLFVRVFANLIDDEFGVLVGRITGISLLLSFTSAAFGFGAR